MSSTQVAHALLAAFGELLKAEEGVAPAVAGDENLVVGSVMKMEDEDRFTLGVAFAADLPPLKKAADGKRDIIREKAIERTAWQWMTKSRQIGLFHMDGTVGHGTVVESTVWRGPDWRMTAVDGSTQIVKKGDWLIGVVWDAPAWNLIKSGQLSRPGFSPQGRARRRTASPELAALPTTRS